MKDFKEVINGKSYNIEQAKQLFIDYTLRHNGDISDRIRNTTVEIYPRCLPNGSTAHANANAEENKIRMVAEKNSIITFFHEFKHIADSWKGQNGHWYLNWEYEDDYTAQMEWTNQRNKEVKIKRGTIGLAMSEATAELYASKIFWELCDNSPQAIAYTANTRKVYDEEIVFLKKICLVLGINEDLLLSWKSENNYGKNQLRSLFAKLTGRQEFWDKLEYRMDYVSMLKFINITYPDFKIHPTSMKNVGIYRENINELLKTCLRHDIQERYYLSMGCSKNEFEQKYKEKVKEFKVLDNYLMPSSPDTDAR